MALNLIKLCQAYRIPYIKSGNEHCGVGWIQLDCPWCGDKSDWHLGYNLDKGYFHCWKCGAKKLREVLLTAFKLPESSLESILARYSILGHSRGIPDTFKRHSVVPPPCLGPLLGQHRRYLRARGYDPAQLAADWALQGTAQYSGAWNWRVIIPVFNINSEIVAYQGRAISDDVTPKYRTTANADMGDDPKSLIYGIHKAIGDAVIIVEGATGVWRLGPPAVATLGIDWKLEQANILRRYQRRYIIFDPEERAQSQADKLASWLSAYPGVTEVVSKFKTDPGEFNIQLVKKIRRALAIM